MTHGRKAQACVGWRRSKHITPRAASLKAEEFTPGEIETVIFHIGHLFLSTITGVQSIFLSFANGQVRLRPCY